MKLNTKKTEGECKCYPDVITGGCPCIPCGGYGVCDKTCIHCQPTEKPMKITSTDTKQKIELTLRSFAERLEKCNLEGVPMGAKRYYKFVDQLYSLYQEGWEEEHCNCVEHYVGEKGKGYWIHARAELLSTLKKVT